MGKYYAEAQGEDEAVAARLRGSLQAARARTICVPADPVSVAVALADKIDTLVGFWAIDEKPTGSKDPYALRRAALGVIRIALSDKHDLVPAIVARRAAYQANLGRALSDAEMLEASATALRFFSDRLKVQLREQGARHDLVDAVFALEGQDASVSSSAASRRWANSSTPRTARICSPATSARPTSSASRRRRTRANMSAARSVALSPGRGMGARPGDRCRQGGGGAPPSRARTSRPPCARWRSCARMSMRSSTR